MWEKKRLGDVAKLKNGYAFKSKEYSDEGVPVIRISDINDNLVTTNNAKRIPMKDEYSCYQIEENSILIAMSGATTGKFGIFRSKEKALQNQRVGKFEYDESKLSNQFLYYLLYDLKRQILKEAYGGAQPNISSKKIEAMEVKIPPLPTQHCIVEKIEELFSKLDHGVENLKKAQQQLKTYRQAVLKDAFEGKLTKEWREQQDDLTRPEELLQQIKAERKAHRQRELAEWEKEVEQWEKDGKPGRKPRKPRKQSSQSPLAEEELTSLITLPNGWKWVQFDNVAEVKTNLVDPEQYKSFPHIAPNYIKKYTGQLLEYNSIEHDGVTSPKHLFYSGQIVYSKIRPYLSKLILAPFDGLCSADMYPIETNLKTKYLYYLMLSDVFLNQASTAGSRSVLPKINQKELGIIKLPICSLREQEEIVNKIESSISIIDQLEQTIKENLQKAEALRQSILKKAFRGELVRS